MSQTEFNFAKPFNPGQLESELVAVLVGPLAAYVQSGTNQGRVIFGRSLSQPEQVIAQGVIDAHVPALPPVPSSIGNGQLRVALRRIHGINKAQLDALVSQVIESLPDAGMREDAQNLWEYASVVDRTHPLIMLAASLLGLTDAQVDEVFRQGALI